MARTSQGHRRGVVGVATSLTVCDGRWMKMVTYSSLCCLGNCFLEDARTRFAIITSNLGGMFVAIADTCW